VGAFKLRLKVTPRKQLTCRVAVARTATTLAGQSSRAVIKIR